MHRFLFSDQLILKYISSFSVAVMKYQGKKQLKEGSLFWFMVPELYIHNGREGLAVGMGELSDHVFIHIQEAERVN